MRLGRWGIVAVGPMVLGVFLVTLAPSRAAESSSTLAAPYAAADHSVERSCSNAVQQCAATSSADVRTGSLSVSALADSGLGGTIPGSAAASAVGQMTQVVDIGPATAATFVFHLHVTKVATSSTDAGRAEVHVWSTALCDNCDVPYEQDAFPDH